MKVHCWLKDALFSARIFALSKLCCTLMYRAVASLTVPGGQESHFPHFSSILINFSSNFTYFFLILVLQVGESPTWEGPGYATADVWNKITLHLFRLCISVVYTWGWGGWSPKTTREARSTPWKAQKSSNSPRVDIIFHLTLPLPFDPPRKNCIDRTVVHHAMHVNSCMTLTATNGV